MKKLSIIILTAMTISFSSCADNSGAANPPVTDTTTDPKNFDSAANNQILPPSAAPGNAGNSSLADTSYHAKDSTKKK